MPLPEPLAPFPANAPTEGQMYLHFKGEVATVIGTSRHTETGEVLVIYRKGDCIWAR